MADLKLNEELPLNEHTKMNIRRIKGNLRLVAFGKTSQVSKSSGWTDTGFSTKTIFDSNYISEGVSSGYFRFLKSGKYLFIWQQRAQDSIAGQGVGIWLTSTDANDNMLMCWGGNKYRDTLQGMYFWNVNAGEEMKTKGYGDAAYTSKPISVWVFAVVGL